MEKHILREHPDPVYNRFVCTLCPKSMPSPQQILDHLGQAVSGGHAIKNQKFKKECVRAVHTETKEQYRYVKHSKKI